jgi:hypothetical protein
MAINLVVKLRIPQSKQLENISKELLVKDTSFEQ